MAKVLLYRPADKMLMCELPFGKPRARMTLPLDVCMAMERAAQEATRVAMEAEDHATTVFWKFDQVR
jgi:hypothetical protein